MVRMWETSGRLLRLLSLLQNRRELSGATAEPVSEQADNRVVEKRCGRGLGPMQNSSTEQQRNNQSREHRQPACEGNGGFMDFAVTRIVHQAGSQAPLLPQRQNEQRDAKRAQQRQEVNVERKSDHTCRSA